MIPTEHEPVILEAAVEMVDDHPVGESVQVSVLDTDVSVTTYWHGTLEDGHLVVEIDTYDMTGPRGVPSTPIRVRHNEAIVYDWKVSP